MYPGIRIQNANSWKNSVFNEYRLFTIIERIFEFTDNKYINVQVILFYFLKDATLNIKYGKYIRWTKKSTVLRVKYVYGSFHIRIKVCTN